MAKREGGFTYIEYSGPDPDKVLAKILGKELMEDRSPKFTELISKTPMGFQIEKPEQEEEDEDDETDTD